MPDTTPKTWMLLSFDETVYGGNTGYPDDPRVSYAYDSLVPSHKELAEGDVVVVAGRQGRSGPLAAMGFARVGEIRRNPGVKPVRHCPKPACDTTNIKARETKSPKYLCKNGHDFEEPRVEIRSVTLYSAIYTGYFDAGGVPSPAELKAMQQVPKDQRAIRPLDRDRFLGLVPRVPGLADLLDVADTGSEPPSPTTIEYGSHDRIKETEEYSVDRAIERMQADYPGHEIRKMHHSNPGYDLEVRLRGKVVRYVEVKGTRRPEPDFFLSEGERQFSEDHADDYTLVVVASIDIEAGTHDTYLVPGAVDESSHALQTSQWRGRVPAGTVPS